MAVTDSTIGNLPVASALNDADKFAIEQSGTAKSLTGAKLKDFIQGEDELFIATDTTTYSAVEAALADGKLVVYMDSNGAVYIHQEKRGTTHFFVGVGVGATPPNLNATYFYVTLTSSGAWVPYLSKELQSKLTFDNTPTANSNNPVTSKGVKAAIDAIPVIEVDDELSDTSENPVQNKVITDAIYNSLVTDTANGDIASFPDGADDIPVKDLKVSIEPIQDLHGYDNPWPAGGGKNKFNKSASGILTGRRIDLATGGTYEASGSNVSEYIPITAGQNYVISGAGAGANRYVAWYASDETFISSTQAALGSPITAPTGSSLVRFDYSASYADTTQIEAGSTATSYAPYSNISPISGWTGANITRTGKNLLPQILASMKSINTVGTWSGNIYTHNGVTFTPVVDGEGNISGITVNGSSSSTSRFIICSGLTINENTILNGGKDNNIRLQVTSDDEQTQIALNTSGDTALTALSNVKVRLLVSGSASNVAIYPMIRLSSVSDATFEPYNGSTINIDWTDEAGTVYGGTLNVTTGKLTVDKISVDLGTRTWNYNTSGNYSTFESGGFNPAGVFVAGRINFLCSRYAPIVPVNGGVFRANNYNGKANITVSANNLQIQDFAYSDPDVFKTAVTGQTIVYTLATPQTYQLTPTEVATLLGNNNIFADTGAVDVEYRADTKLYIQKMLEA